LYDYDEKRGKRDINVVSPRAAHRRKISNTIIMSNPATPAATPAAAPHELNIQSYTLDELLDLFHLDYNLSVDDIKQAKHKVLMLHPDKSKLPVDYFLFYKRAFDKIVELYDDLQRQDRPITKESTKYNTEVLVGREPVFSPSSHLHKQIQKETRAKDYNRKFNELFEKNMTKRPNTDKNKWFSVEDPNIVLPDRVTVENMGSVIENLRTTTSAMVQYTGVNELYSNHSGSTLYDDDEGAQYISSDVFNKLKFEDIRKVHKDETIIPIRSAEQTAADARRTITVDEYISQRSGSTDEMPMAKNEAERILAEKFRQQKEQILKNQYKSKLETEEYAQKNSKVMAHFLRVGF
jgi:hypothetical protein